MRSLSSLFQEIEVSGMGRKEKRQALNEVDVLRRLLHPFIVKYHEAYCTQGTLHICMEFAAGAQAW